MIYRVNITFGFTSKISSLLALAVLFFLISLSAKGQSTADYEALKAAIGDEKYNHLSQHNPDALAEMAFVNRHGWHVSNLDEKEAGDFPDILEMPALYPSAQAATLALLESGNWDMAAFAIFPKEKEYIYFSIGQSNKLLVILPKTLARKKFNEIYSE